MKPVVWVGDSKERLRLFPPDAMRDAGYQLHLLQIGRSPTDWKPMPSIGIGVSEIRVRVFPEAVYVLHAFQKKSTKTLRLDIAIARHRLRAVLTARRES